MEKGGVFKQEYRCSGFVITDTIACVLCQRHSAGPRPRAWIKELHQLVCPICMTKVSPLPVSCFQLGFAPVLESIELSSQQEKDGDEEDGGDGNRLTEALHDFSQLCKRLAAMYAGTGAHEVAAIKLLLILPDNAPCFSLIPHVHTPSASSHPTSWSTLPSSGHNLLRTELLRIVRAGINYSLVRPPSQLHFMAWGLGPFTAKVSVPQYRPQSICCMGTRVCVCVCVCVCCGSPCGAEVLRCA